MNRLAIKFLESYGYVVAAINTLIVGLGLSHERSREASAEMRCRGGVRARILVPQNVEVEERK